MEPGKETTLTPVASRATEQDPMAEITEIVNTHEAPLLRYAARIVRNEEYARDIVQEAFIRWIKLPEESRLEIRNLPAWLFRITRNLCLDHLRRAKRRYELSLEEAPGGVDWHHRLPDDAAKQPDRMVATAEEMQLVRKQIMALDARSREVLILKLEQQHSYREIAEIMELSVSNVGFILHNAMKKLSAAMREISRTGSES